ncbi:MAG: GMC family oxidoreductase N-terminal domain-containing protein, partial [Myxococcales bacterium]|nr:GMC family oxidoreductase N-terminal domain-containing protein [Myxococcales bacterium]
KELPGWPISLQQLNPYYDEVQREIGISTLLAHPSAAWIENGARKAGLRALPIPRAILSSDFRGRQACTYCGFCGSYGCEVGAKSSTLETFLRDARLTLRAGCRVTRLLAGDGRANGVLFLDEKRREQRAKARVVAVACSAIETARLLLASEVANSSGLLGKNLMFATLASGYGRFPRGGADPSDRLPFIDRAVEQPEGVILFQRPHPNPIFEAEKLAWNPSGPPAFGAELKRRMREFFHETRTLEWESFSDFAPHAGCEVSLDPEVKDPAGQPAARVRIGVHPDSLATSDKLAARAREVMAASGATKQGQTSDERVYTVLQCGTARMGVDAATSVVNPACEAHDVKGLYVADSSSFCSSGSAPFTFTIMANALRVGAGIIERMRKREL